MADSTAQQVGGNVRAEMARHRLTQEDIARRLLLSQAAVSRRLDGTKPFDVEELGKLSRVFGVPLSRLVAGAERRAASVPAPESVAADRSPAEAVA